MPGKNTRASTGGIDPYVMFPVMEAFLPSNQLSTHKSVIAVLRHLTSGGRANTSHKVAVREVAKLVWCKWYHDTVFCWDMRLIERKLEDLWSLPVWEADQHRHGELH